MILTVARTSSFHHFQFKLSARALAPKYLFVNSNIYISGTNTNEISVVASPPRIDDGHSALRISVHSLKEERDISSSRTINWFEQLSVTTL